MLRAGEAHLDCQLEVPGLLVERPVRGRRDGVEREAAAATPGNDQNGQYGPQEAQRPDERAPGRTLGYGPPVKVAIVVPYSWSFWGGVVDHAEQQLLALRKLGVDAWLVIGNDPPGSFTHMLHPGLGRHMGPPEYVLPVGVP